MDADTLTTLENESMLGVLRFFVHSNSNLETQF
jgi:hypothetical protein